MREAELLNALAQGRNGVQVNLTRTYATVTTLYAPSARGTGKTLMEAALNCVHDLSATLNKVPQCRELIPEVVQALEDYDQHSIGLQI